MTRLDCHSSISYLSAVPESGPGDAEGDLRFDTCKRRTQAKMDTLAEREMPVFLPVQVESVRLCKLRQGLYLRLPGT